MENVKFLSKSDISFIMIAMLSQLVVSTYNDPSGLACVEAFIGKRIVFHEQNSNSKNDWLSIKDKISAFTSPITDLTFILFYSTIV